MIVMIILLWICRSWSTATGSLFTLQWQHQNSRQNDHHDDDDDDIEAITYCDGWFPVDSEQPTRWSLYRYLDFCVSEPRRSIERQWIWALFIQHKYQRWELWGPPMFGWQGLGFTFCHRKVGSRCSQGVQLLAVWAPGCSWTWCSGQFSVFPGWREKLAQVVSLPHSPHWPWVGSHSDVGYHYGDDDHT